MAATSNPKVSGVDHPVPNWQRDQPNIPLALATASCLLVAYKSRARISHREIRALEPDVKAKLDYSLNLNSAAFRFNV